MPSDAQQKAASVRDWDDRPWRYNKRTPPPPPASGPPPPKGATMNQTPEAPLPEPLPLTDPPLEQPDTGDNDDDTGDDEEDE